MVVQGHYEMYAAPNRKRVARAKVIRLGKLEKLNGKLMHATIGIRNGQGLLSPLISTTKGRNQFYKDKTVHLNLDTQQVLQYWTTLLELANRQPTLCANLIPALADYGVVTRRRTAQAGSGFE